MQTCRESQQDGGLMYVCVVVVGAVKGSSEARNGICYWDYRTTSGPSQMQLISTGIHGGTTNNDLQNHIWTPCNPCVSISAPINTEYQRPHPSIYGSVSKTDIGTFPSAETVGLGAGMNSERHPTLKVGAVK